MRVLVVFVLLLLSSLNATAFNVGDQAPNFELKMANGETFKLADHIGKKPIYLMFWATWCPACKREIPSWKKLYEELNQDVTFLGVNIGVDNNMKNVRWYQNKHQLPYPLALDEGTVISKQYGLKGTPWQVLIDKTGKVRYIGNRTLTQLGQNLKELNAQP